MYIFIYIYIYIYIVCVLHVLNTFWFLVWWCQSLFLLILSINFILKSFSFIHLHYNYNDEGKSVFLIAIVVCC